jgi:hypothetical protein
MNKRNILRIARNLLAAQLLIAFAVPACAAPGASIGGFIPFVGIGLTNQFQTFDNDPTGTFFIADPSNSWGGTPLGPGSSAYFDVALLDTGAATHILTQQAASATGFSIQAEGFRGTNFQVIGGATGQLDLRINDPMGIYAAGLGDRTGAGAALTMNTSAFRGQTSVAMLEAPSEWELPNIIGLPMAAHHGIAIRNSDPQIFQHQGRTMRTPQVDFIELGTGNQQGILRRTNLKLRPGIGFISGPQYVQNLDILGGNFAFHDNPLSPTVVENGALFIEVDMANGNKAFQDKELLFDTGADFTVISELTAARLGFDPLIDTPDFYLEVEGSGGVSSGVPGIFLDELNIDTVGGSFTLHNVPVAILDVTNPNDPGNIIDGIIGMHLFNGRDLVIDANPSIGQGGTGPSLFISDPVTTAKTWTSTAASGTWATGGNWNGAAAPSLMSDVTVAHVAGGNQTAIVAADSTVFRLTVSGTSTNEMKVQINSGATLTTFGETLIEEGGHVALNGGSLDTQFVNIDGGTLSGSGEIFAGVGPVKNPVRNLSGRIEPGAPIGELTIDGDLSNQAEGTIAFDLGGTTAITQYDRISVGRTAFLAGTLEVSLLNSFSPAIGNMFTILTADNGVVGEFESLQLPAGLTWSVTYNANDVVLAVTGLGLSGDYNGDGIVNAADYTTWRDSLGQVGSNLAADGNGNGSIDAGDYDVWKNNFGQGGGSGSLGSTPVPEPATLTLFAVLAAAGIMIRRK